MRLLVAIAIIVALGLFIWHGQAHGPVERPPGVLAPGIPVQTKVENASPFQHGRYTVTPLAHFRLEARVLSSKRYRLDAGARISPVDLALGWGRMSDSAVLDSIRVRQHHRFYHWQTKKYPIPRGEIISHSANMHMIPADSAVKRNLFRVRPGQVVQLDGFLVSVSRDDGWRWQSSLTRADAGRGACELVWVKTLSCDAP